MKVYLVGGAVRDRLLGLPVRERDWVVVGATETEMLAAGFSRADADFPVFLHPETREEYALARTERKTGSGYKGFSVDAGPDVTLEQDLARRDLTINALAEEEDGELLDPYGGLEDLRARRMRHITPAFTEDPVRLLRVARFAAKLGGLGFELAADTAVLMADMGGSDDLAALKPERLWLEMRKALAEPESWRFFQILHECGALHRLMPDLARAMDAGTSPAPIDSLRRCVASSPDPRVRFAAVMYPALAFGTDAGALCHRLRAERAYEELLDLLFRHGGTFAQAPTLDAPAVHELLEQTRALQQEARFECLLQASNALWPTQTAIVAARFRQALAAMRGIHPTQLLEQGFEGAALGQELAKRRVQAIRAVLG